MMHGDAAHPNCAYLWMEHTLSSNLQSDLSVWFGSNPVVPAACEDGSGQQTKEGCAANGFDDFDRIRFWTTPVSKCPQGGVRALLPLGLGLHRGDRRPLTPHGPGRRLRGRVASLRRRARRRRRRPRDRRGRVLRHARALGLGQDHLPAADLRLRDADRRPRPPVRRGGRAHPAQPAQRQHRLPGLCALPAPERARQRRLRPDGEGRAEGRAPRRGRGDAGPRPPRGLRRPQAVAALRRPAPARRARPRARQPRRASSCSTSRSARSTSSCARRCRTS